MIVGKTEIEVTGVKIVWEGEVPKDFSANGRFGADYNGAIAWIKEQIAKSV
jgi:hypothetical protein